MLSALHPLENIEKYILSKLLDGKCDRKKQEIMQFYQDIERINPSIDVIGLGSSPSTINQLQIGMKERREMLNNLFIFK